MTSLVMVSGARRAWTQTIDQPRSQTNFTISPSPVGYEKYQDALISKEAPGASGVSWLTSVGGVAAVVRAKHASMVALGVQAAPRVAYGPTALSLSVAATRMVGKVFDLDMSFWIVGVAPVAELCIVQLESTRLVAFAGYNVTWSRGSFSLYDLPYATTTVDTGVNITTLMHGPILGAQLAVLVVPDLMVTPHVTVRSLGGKSDPEPLVNLWRALDEPITIPRFWSTTFGVDVIYQPWNLSLGALADIALPSADNERIQTYILALSYVIRPH